MPKYVTPAGRADLDRTAEDLSNYLRQRARGAANIIGTKELSEIYDIKPWQVYTCMMVARDELRHDDNVLCSRTGPGGGWFIAETEEEARLFGVRRSETALTILENTLADMETALLGVVRSEPMMEPYWKRSRSRLVLVARELTKVRYELTVASVDVEDRPALDEGSPEDDDTP
jgi:hypothetical protein